jgi:hypothetical protein
VRPFASPFFPTVRASLTTSSGVGLLRFENGGSGYDGEWPKSIDLRVGRIGRTPHPGVRGGWRDEGQERGVTWLRGKSSNSARAELFAYRGHSVLA